MLIRMRNRINHVLLNALLVARYHARRRPGLIRCVLAIEAACAKLGLIFYRSSALSGGRPHESGNTRRKAHGHV